MKILFVASEAKPFAKVGGLADVVGSLPLELGKSGIDARIAIPAYKAVLRGAHTYQRLIDTFQVKLGDTEKSVSVLEAKSSPVPVYFVNCPEFFDRVEIYQAYEAFGSDDNLERYTLFCNAVMELMKRINWIPDIIHAHDWQTALLPAYLKQAQGKQTQYRDIGSLFTVHNLGYQGIYPWEKFDLLGWDENIMTTDAIEYYGKVNLMKAGLLCADKINTVSPNYRDETLRGGATGAGLEWILRQRQSDYYGILNGIDYEEWSPAEDRFISYRLDGGWNRFKLTNKKALFKACRFDERELFKPVLAIITRFAHQKGVDVLLQAVKGLVERGCKFVALGYGEKDLEALLYIFAKDYPTSVFSDFSHNEALAHQIYAGADMFVMPSRYEPCGLTQMIAMRYGTIPIVADVGGLKDSVTDFDSVTGEGTGFKINHHSAENILQTVDKALTAYGDRILWGELVERVAEVDFSWGKSAERYIELYKGIQCSRRS